MARQPAANAETISGFATTFESIVGNIATVIQGKEPPTRLALVCLLSEGHLLLEDVPGVGKTTMAKALARSFDLDWRRIQFTPDLLPSDVTGTSVYDREAASFSFRPGAVFANVVLADEINRASPKTQAALLEAMQERQVTIDNVTHQLPHPFLVIATQNPVEYEGTYPLPEAQLDRFLLQVDVSYPDQGAERRMLFATTGNEERRVEQVLTAPELQSIQRLVRQLPVPDKVVEAILRLARSARPGTGAGPDTDRLIAWGPGPRASQALMLAVRAKALIDGRLAPSVDDVVALAEPILKHRMALTFAARAEGETASGVINRLTAALG